MLGKARGSLVVLFCIIGAVFLLLANATVWANRTVFDTDNFVDTVNRALDDEEVQQQLALRLSTRLIVQGDVQERLNEALPENLRLLAPLLTRQAQEIVFDIILRIIQNERFGAVFDTALRTVHAQVLRILEGDTAVIFEDGKVIIDLGEVLRQAADQLGANADGLLARIDLPEDAGHIVLVEDAETTTAIQNLVSLHDQITWLVLGIAIASFVAAVAIARDNRDTLRTVGIVVMICGLLAMTALLGIRPIVSGLADNAAAGRAVFDALVEDFRWQSFVLVIVGLVLALGATLAGDSELARSARNSVRRGSDPSAPPLGDAIRANATVLRVVGFAAAALVLVAWPDPTDRVRVTTFVLVGVYFLALWIITGGSSWAESARGYASSMWNSAQGSDPSQRNDTVVGRYAKWLRIAGVVVAVLMLVMIPGVGLGAIAAIVAFTFVYLALIDWMATRPADA
jgi:hypothetical protein